MFPFRDESDVVEDGVHSRCRVMVGKEGDERGKEGREIWRYRKGDQEGEKVGGQRWLLSEGNIVSRDPNKMRKSSSKSL